MSNNADGKTSPGRWALQIGIGLLLVALVALLVWKWNDIWRLVQDKEAFKAWMLSLGPWAPAAFVFVQFLQVVVFIIPGEVPQIAGGYLFGVGWGLVYSLIGIGLGSAFAFAVARTLGIGFVSKLFGKDQVGKFEAFISSPRAVLVFFLLFLIPGIPKDILCYVAGVSYLGFGGFMAISMLGRLPALAVSMVIGHALAQSDWTLLWVIGAAACLLFALGVVFRKQVNGWVERVASRGKPKADEAGGETE